MSNYVVFDKSTGIILYRGAERAAKSARTRGLNTGKWSNPGDIVVTNEADYNANHRKTNIVKNLLSDKDVEIDVNTPRPCDPSSELYWSM